METIRNRLIHHGASVEVLPGVVRIRLNKSFPYQKEVLDILNELRQKVQIEEVGSIIRGAIRSEALRAQNNSRGISNQALPKGV